ncbi:MAG: long-chain-fatty-acid--CoA ligase [Proteobacteria bacterium]|nr:long-chain-fatty-acid--CoA ligase [Pseudomonadota bacterium]
MILSETLNKAARLFPRKEAIRCGDHVFTYREFAGRINGLAHALKHQGIGKGDKVAVLLPNCHCFLEAYFAVAGLGAVCVPLNFRLSAREITFILTDSEARILIADPMFAGQVSELREGDEQSIKVVWTGQPGMAGSSADLAYEDLIAQQAGIDHIESPAQPEDVAQIYYTSGTTGRPKGVMLSHKNVYLHALGTVAELNLTDRDVWVHAAPLFHLADAWATWAITLVGGTHVLVREFNAQAVLRIFEKEKATITNLIPTMLNMMVNHPEAGRFDYSSLRALLSGGAPIAPEVVRRIVETFKCDYIQTYGMTETSPYLTLSLLKGHLQSLSHEEQLRFKAKTGREFIAVELKVVNDRGEEVRQDEKEVGEIIVRGDTVTAGYWKLPEETAKSIRDGWLYTGDMAVIDGEGYVTIVDRKKDMILTGGENVYSTEVENVLYMHPAVLECAVVGIPDDKWGEAVKGIVVLKPDHKATEEELIGFCKERIARYKAPKSIDFISALPKTGSGKIEKKKLRDAYWRDREKKIQ